MDFSLLAFIDGQVLSHLHTLHALVTERGGNLDDVTLAFMYKPEPVRLEHYQTVLRAVPQAEALNDLPLVTRLTVFAYGMGLMRLAQHDTLEIHELQWNLNADMLSLYFPNL